VPTVKTDFFGTAISVNKIQAMVPHLANIDEKAVAAYGSSLAKLKIGDLTNEVLRISSDLKLNDWAIYLLISRLFDVYFPNGSDSEKVVFTTFMLNQLGYRAKIGRTQSELVQLLAISNKVFGAFFFTFGNESGVKYAVINPKRKDMSSVKTCNAEYAGATKNIEISLRSEPKFANEIYSKTLNYSNVNYNLRVNRNMIDFYSTFPRVEFSMYVSAPLDKTFLQSIKAEILPKITGKSQEEQVNFLLHFVQYAFQYKNDQEQYGYEKWNFAEETLISKFSDCDDRAVFFAQLVKNLLGMKVVLLYYPGQHLATAVRFDDQQLNGSHVNVENSRFLVCDPTYIGATIGMEMSQLQNIPVEIVK
jgi:hypothetical protein